MADRKVAKKAPIPLPTDRVVHKKVQRKIAIVPLPETKPKPTKRKIPKQDIVPVKKKPYTELKILEREGENPYEPISTATRENARNYESEQRENQADNITPASAVEESEYDDVRNQSCHNREGNKNRLMAVTKLAVKQEPRGDASVKRTSRDTEVHYESVRIQSLQNPGNQNNKMKVTEAVNKLAIAEDTCAVPVSSGRDDKIHYENVHIHSYGDSNDTNQYANFKMIDNPDDDELTEMDFKTNCFYAYRKMILIFGITAMAITLLVSVLALAAVGASQASQNALRYEELEIMAQTMAEHVLSLEKQLNYTLMLSETTSEDLNEQSEGLNNHIIELEKQLASSVSNLTSTLESLLSNSSNQTSFQLQVLESDVAVLRDDIDSLSDSTVPRSDFDQKLNNITEEFRVQQKVISQQFMSDITTLTNKTEQLNSDLLQLTAHTIPINCYMTIKETIAAVNATTANSPSHNTRFQNVSIYILL